MTGLVTSPDKTTARKGVVRCGNLHSSALETSDGKLPYTTVPYTAQVASLLGSGEGRTLPKPREVDQGLAGAWGLLTFLGRADPLTAARSCLVQNSGGLSKTPSISHTLSRQARRDDTQ
jgi:hypothetical protein